MSRDYLSLYQDDAPDGQNTAAAATGNLDMAALMPDYKARPYRSRARSGRLRPGRNRQRASRASAVLRPDEPEYANPVNR